MQAGYRITHGAPCTLLLMLSPAADDPYLTEDERIAMAIERRYRDLVTGTMQRKSISPERLALIFASIAEGLLDTADDLG